MCEGLLPCLDIKLPCDIISPVRHLVIHFSMLRKASDLKRLRELEAENSQLKRMYADLSLENNALKELISKKL